MFVKYIPPCFCFVYIAIGRKHYFCYGHASLAERNTLQIFCSKTCLPAKKGEKDKAGDHMEWWETIPQVLLLVNWCFVAPQLFCE